MGIVPVSFAKLKDRSPRKTSINNLVFLHSCGDLWSEAAKKIYVGAGDNVLTLAFGAVVIDVFVKDIIEGVDPRLVVEINKVHELGRNDVHRVDVSAYTIGPRDEELMLLSSVRGNGFIGIFRSISSHEPPHTLGCFYGAGEREV